MLARIAGAETINNRRPCRRVDKRSQRSTGGSMKKFTVLSLVAAAMVFAPAVFAQSIVGESLDSGLGTLTAAVMRAYMHPNHVAGEKVDSGLGELAAADLAP